MRWPSPRRERQRPSYDVLRGLFVALHEDVGNGPFDFSGRRGGAARGATTGGQGTAVECATVQRSAVEGLDRKSSLRLYG